MNVKSFEQAVSQEARSLVERQFTLLRIANQYAEEHLRMSVVWRHFNRLDRHHAHARIFQFARDQLLQIALDLIRDLEAAVWS